MAGVPLHMTSGPPAGLPRLANRMMARTKGTREAQALSKALILSQFSTVLLSGSSDLAKPVWMGVPGGTETEV